MPDQRPPDARDEDLGTYQMLWDCSYCGAPKLLARDHKHCPNCGGAQDPSWRYFPADEDKVKVEDHVYVGKDVICAACEAPNTANAAYCSSCGAELDGSKQVRLRGEQSAAEGQGFAADSAKAARAEAKAEKAAANADRQAAADAAHGAPPPDEKKGAMAGKLAVLGCLALLIGAAVCAGVFVFWTKDAQLQATGLTWATTIAVEEKRSVSESAWKDEVPAGAERVSCRPEKRSTRSVPDGETCTNVRKDQGDGTFKESKQCTPKTRDEAVMADKCSYTVNRWVKTREAKATGDKAQKLSWPDPKLRRTGECVGCERAGAKAELFTIQWKEVGGKKAHSCEAPRAVWDKVKPGDKYAVPMGVVSEKLDCGKL